MLQQNNGVGWGSLNLPPWVPLQTEPPHQAPAYLHAGGVLRKLAGKLTATGIIGLSIGAMRHLTWTYSVNRDSE